MTKRNTKPGFNLTSQNVKLALWETIQKLRHKKIPIADAVAITRAVSGITAAVRNDLKAVKMHNEIPKSDQTLSQFLNPSK